MPLRSPGRRAISRFAVLVLMPMLAGSSGCRWLPRRHPAPSIDPRTVSKPGTQASDLAPQAKSPGSPELAEVPLPPLPLRPVSDAEALAAVPGLPTPQLDQALQKAHALDQAFVKGLDDRESASPSTLLPPRPRPLETSSVASSVPPSQPGLPALEPTPPLESDTRFDQSVSPASFPSETTIEAPQDPAIDTPADTDSTWTVTLDQLLELAKSQANGEPTPGLWAARCELLEWLSKTNATHEQDEPPAWETVLTLLAEAQTRATETDIEPEPKSEPPSNSLTIADLRLCRQVTGFGQYEPIAASEIRAGRELMLYWEVEGFQTVCEEELYRTRLASELEILPAESETPVWSRAFNDPEDVCRRPRRDYFVNYRLTIPESLAPGSYRVRLTLQDRQADQSSVRDLAFDLAP